jgi:hypothetical protein
MTRRTIEIAAFCVALLSAAMSIRAWLDSREEQERLASTLAAQKQLLDAANARELTRQSALETTLAQIESLKRATQTPQQILASLPKYLSLPQPITLAPSANSSVASAQQDRPAAVQQRIDASAKSATRGQSSAPRTDASPILPSAPAAQIPSADLKPLYDYVQDCRSCQAQLAAAKQDKIDDDAKIAALTTERDAAVAAAKGGTFWRRPRRNAIWFAAGAALGAAAGYRTANR